MAANVVISVIDIATLDTELIGNMVMPKNNVFQYSSVAAGHWLPGVQAKKQRTIDLRHGC